VVPAGDLAAIEATIATINAAGKSGVSAQRTALEHTVHPDRAADQAACRPASITVQIDAVLAELRPDPSWKPMPSGVGSGSAAAEPGTVYRVPALLEVFTDGLRSATDMTLLHLAVADGRAFTFPLCFT
jgi:hypothetical protein